MDLNNERLALLLQKYVDKTLTELEREELSALLRNNWGATSNYYNEQQTWPQQVEWKEMLRNIVEKKDHAPVRKMYFLRTSWLKYAASVVVLLCSALYFTKTDKPSAPSINTSKVITDVKDVLPGSNKAILTLADGTTIALDNVENGTIATQGSIDIVKKDGLITYDPQLSVIEGGAVSSIGLNTMSAPRGGQYKLMLPDGSRVWLNAASSITYPTMFSGDTRVVSITGEAYFEVAKNASKPFIVKTYSKEITVLGTSFNVNSYLDEGMVKISLLEGSVRVDKQTLKPGQAYIGGKIITTNLEQDLAWKNGFFYFDNADLPTVLRQLSRWYNVDIIYEGAIQERAYIGEIERSLTLQQVLEVLSQTRINYKIEKDNVIKIIP